MADEKKLTDKELKAAAGAAQAADARAVGASQVPDGGSQGRLDDVDLRPVTGGARAADARELGLSNLSDLAKLVNDGAALTLATSVEFSARPDGLKPMEREYGFKFPRENIKAMDPGETYESLRNEEVDVALVASGDARVASYDLFVFEDDKRVFLTHVLAPVVRSETLERMPELATIVNAFSAKLDNATLRRLNARVEVEDKPLEDVARNFLHEQGLI